MGIDNFEVGERVYSKVYGYGKVIRLVEAYVDPTDALLIKFLECPNRIQLNVDSYEFETLEKLEIEEYVEHLELKYEKLEQIILNGIVRNSNQ